MCAFTIFIFTARTSSFFYSALKLCPFFKRFPPLFPLVYLARGTAFTDRWTVYRILSWSAFFFSSLIRLWFRVVDWERVVEQLQCCFRPHIVFLFSFRRKQ